MARPRIVARERVADSGDKERLRIMTNSFSDDTDLEVVSRTVISMVEAGNRTNCDCCDEPIKFQAKMRHRVARVNIYETENFPPEDPGDVRWVKKVEYHGSCYPEVQERFGEPTDSPKNVEEFLAALQIVDANAVVPVIEG